MSRKEPMEPTPWVVAQDEHALLAYVCVGQKMGTRGYVSMTRHHLLENEETVSYGKYGGDATDNSWEAMVTVLEQMLEAAKHARKLERERNHVSN